MNETAIDSEEQNILLKFSMNTSFSSSLVLIKLCNLKCSGWLVPPEYMAVIYNSISLELGRRKLLELLVHLDLLMTEVIFANDKSKDSIYNSIILKLTFFCSGKSKVLQLVCLKTKNIFFRRDISALAVAHLKPLCAFLSRKSESCMLVTIEKEMPLFHLNSASGHWVKH